MFQKYRHAVLVAALGFGAASAQAPLDVRVALVFGNSAYPGPASLQNPVNDAAAMSAALRTLGFAVTEVKDATLAQMRDAIDRAAAELKGKQAVGVLYYAGHGVQIDFRNYMIPVDAKLASAQDVQGTAIDVGRVIDAYKSSGTRMNILVLDACRDNPFATVASGKGLAPLDAPSGTFLAYATAPGNVAEDGDAASGNGVYTGFLVKELQKPATKIEDVFKRVRLQVRRQSQGRQIPWESTSLEEDFYFNDGVKYTFKAEDLARAGDAARKEVDAAAERAREQARLKQLSAQKTREEAYRIEKSEWDRVKDSRNADDFYAFLNRYPSGNWSEIAQLQIDKLQKAKIHAQAEAGAKPQESYLDRYREGDVMEFVQKDGLTGLQIGQGTIRIHYLTDDEFEGAVVNGNLPGARGVRGGFVSHDGLGTYDPPWVAVPGGDLQVGKRAQGRSVRTDARGNKGWIDYESRVLSKEKLQTAFGVVDTYKVEVIRMVDTGMRQKITFWFEPDWGYAVKSITENRSGGAPQIFVREMVKRSRKS